MAELQNSGVISTGNVPPPAAWDWLELARPLPEDVKDCISCITRSLRNSTERLTENHLWEAVAAKASPEWRQARADLTRADDGLRHIESDEHAPLGLIGHALDGEETSRVRAEQDEALAHFILLDEALRGDRELQRQLNVLHTHWQAIETSLQMAREMCALTRKHEKTEAPPASSGSFSLKGMFGRFSQSFSGRKPGPAISSVEAQQA